MSTRVLSSAASTDVIHFAWSRGGAGTLSIDWTAAGLIARMVVTFG